MSDVLILHSEFEWFSPWISKVASLLADKVDVIVEIEGSWAYYLFSSKDESSFGTNENESISLEYDLFRSKSCVSEGDGLGSLSSSKAYLLSSQKSKMILSQ